MFVCSSACFTDIDNVWKNLLNGLQTNYIQNICTFMTDYLNVQPRLLDEGCIYNAIWFIWGSPSSLQLSAQIPWSSPCLRKIAFLRPVCIYSMIQKSQNLTIYFFNHFNWYKSVVQYIHVIRKFYKHAISKAGTFLQQKWMTDWDVLKSHVCIKYTYILHHLLRTYLTDFDQKYSSWTRYSSMGKKIKWLLQNGYYQINMQSQI